MSVPKQCIGKQANPVASVHKHGFGVYVLPLSPLFDRFYNILELSYIELSNKEN
jgi:hypothetical protein